MLDNKLNDAAINGNNEVVSELIKLRANVNNTIGSNGFTPLLFAVGKGHLSTVEMLIQCGADVKVREGEHNRTALHIAACFGHIEIIKLLINKGCSPKERDKDNKTALLHASYNNKIETVKWLLENEHSLITEYDNKGNHAIHYASMYGYKDIVELLVRKYPEVVKQYNWNFAGGEWTALHFAAKYGHLDIIKILTQFNATVDATASYNDKCGYGGGETALHVAIQDDHISIVKYLIENAKANTSLKTHSESNTPLLIAAKLGRKDIVEYLLYKKIGILEETNYNKDTPLFLAIKGGHTEIIDWLLDQGADINYTHSNITVESLANNCKNKEIINLIQYHQLCNNIKSKDTQTVKISHSNHKLYDLMDKYGNTLYHLCAQSNKYIDNLDIDLGLPNYNGETALHIAVEKDSKAFIENLLKESKSKNKDLSFIDKGNKDGDTAMHIACRRGDNQVVTTLMEFHPYFESKNQNEQTFLHILAEQGHIELFKLIIANVSYSNCYDANKKSPLASAVEHGRLDIIEYLKDLKKTNKRYETIFHDKDKEGNNLMHTAVYGGHANIVEMIFRVDPVFFKSDTNREGLLPVHLAAGLGRTEILTIFNDKGINNINETIKNNGWSPLHVAVMSGQSKTVHWFCEQSDTRLDLKDKNGKSPVDYAKESNRMDIASLINTEITIRHNRKGIKKNDYTPKINIKNLVFEGGGVKGLAYLGALEALEDKGIYVNKIERVAGTSAGAITATLIGLGYSLTEINEKLKKLDFISLLDGNREIKIEDINTLTNNFSKSNSIFDWLYLGASNYKKLEKIFNSLAGEKGLYDGEFIRKWTEEVIEDRFHSLNILLKNLTFMELHTLKLADTGNKYFFKDIYMKGVNVSKQRVETFSYEDTPDVIIADAVRISMSIPFIFKPHKAYKKNSNGIREKISDDLYIDGGVQDNYPIRIFDDQKYITDSQNSFNKHHRNFQTLGLCLLSSNIENKDSENQNSNISMFIKSILMIFYNTQKYFYGFDRRSIIIDTLDISTIEFNLDNRSKNLLFLKGKEAIDNYIKENGRFNFDSETPLQALVSLGLHQGGVFSITSANGIFMLFRSASNFDVDALKKLGLNLNVKNDHGNTAMHLAALYGYDDCIARLIECGATSSLQNEEGEYPADIALKHKHSSVIKVLIASNKQESNSPNELIKFNNESSTASLLSDRGIFKTSSDTKQEQKITTNDMGYQQQAKL